MSILREKLGETDVFQKVINLIKHFIHSFTHKTCGNIKNIMPPEICGFKFILNEKLISVNKYKKAKSFKFCKKTVDKRVFSIYNISATQMAV